MPVWRKRNQAEYERMAALIQENPGIRPAALAQRLGVARSTVQRRLPSLEEMGYLLYEDQSGRLFFWRKVKR
ncbi:MAG TPA: winged helix-turn-helix domain-containing protein [Chloroflexi bacterium]|nr:winged helix-turn-helix domain-containing protein [Chloroflexota bacterium]